MEWSANENYIDKNPCRSVKPIKFTENERQCIDNVELEKIRNVCETKRDRALVEFLYSTGARVQEVERMKITDINFEKNEVTLFGKGEKYRKSYISKSCKYYLLEYLQERTDGLDVLFRTNRKPYKNLTKAGIERVIRELGQKAEIGRHLFPHLFRHSVATDMIRKGVPITQVQKMLGHSNVNTTLIYAKTADTDVAESHRRFID